ncbi:hypothetical protein [Humibacter sp.]|uniref:hypothetical protein n=1 Tax=Humibacter sp. TaxID=1940291 RepID=UPI003F7EAC0D
MGKSTHPFVLKMNEAKAFHRAMRAGEHKEPKGTERSAELAVEDTVADTNAAKGTRYLTLTHKQPSDAPPPKGVLSIVVPK